MGTADPKQLKGNYYLLGDLLLVREHEDEKGQSYRGAEIGEYELLDVPVPDRVRQKAKVK